jgi:myosin heavy subunit
LNSQIQILTRENEELKGSIAQIQHEKSEYKRLFEQLKQETSGKWKFKERDDWKCLVDNIQQDRTRLQEENNQLNALLSTTSKQVEELKTEIQKLYSEKDELEEANRLLLADVEELKTSGERPKTITIETDEDENGMNGGSFPESKEGGMSDEQKLVLSPIVDESTGRRLFSFDTSVSPHSLAKRLKEELRRTHSQVCLVFVLHEGRRVS